MHNFGNFRDSVSDDYPPDDVGPALQALWWARKGDWERAHIIAGDRQDDADCNLVHAHLHRAKGEAKGADYWYAQSGRPRSELPLDQEWNVIAADLLSISSSGSHP